MPEVHVVYRVTRDLTDQHLALERECLSAEEHARANRFVFADDRRDFIAAHGLLRQTLSAHEPRDPKAWTFSEGAHGKPRLADRTALTFSVSHTRGLVACVVSPHLEVGIDVEPTSQSVEVLDIARERFSSQEVRSLGECDRTERAAQFIELWTLKEAYAKATGEGVLGGMAACTFALGPADSLSSNMSDSGRSDAWVFAVFAVLDYRLAVAVHDPGKRCRALSIRDSTNQDDAEGHELRLLRKSTRVVVT